MGPTSGQMAEGDKHTLISAHGELDLAEGRSGDVDRGVPGMVGVGAMPCGVD